MVEVFEEIQRSKEWLAIPHLTDFLLSPKAEVRGIAGRTIRVLLDAMPAREYPTLDQASRDYANDDQAFDSAWVKLRPQAVDSLRDSPEKSAAFGVASFHANGRIRQAAVAHLAEIRDGSELPFLLLRANDWVHPVRTLATELVRQRIRADYAQHFLRYFPLALRLERCGHYKGLDLLTSVRDLLGEMPESDLIGCIRSEDRRTRREALNLFEGFQSFSDEFRQEIMAHSDPAIRQWGARVALRGLLEKDILPLLLRLLGDPEATVRREALGSLAKMFPTQAGAAVRSGLLDTTSSVRWTAQYWLSKFEPSSEPSTVYRASLNGEQSAKRRAAILGLAETGSKADAALLFPFLQDSKTAVRKAAIRAISKLNGESAIGDFTRLLTDASPGVSREASDALRPFCWRVADSVVAIFRTDERLFVRKNCFKLLARQSFWPQDIFLFEALRDSSEEIIALARKAIDGWLYRSRSCATGASAEQLNELRRALKASAGMLTAEQIREIEFLLRTG